jgi:hypothetical protein
MFATLKQGYETMSTWFVILLVIVSCLVTVGLALVLGVQVFPPVR